MAGEPLSELIDKFATDLVTTLGRNRQTAANYRHYLERFTAVAGGQSAERIKPENI